MPAKESKPRWSGTPKAATFPAAGGAAVAGAVVASLMSLQSATKKPRTWVGDGELKEKVLPHCSMLLQPYRPSPMAVNTHAQNILGFLRIASLPGQYRRQLIIAHDGGTLGLDWWGGCDQGTYGCPETPILLVLHGINGGSHEGYCKWQCKAAVDHGWRATALNYRGCNGLPLTSPRGYAATLTHDIHYAITSIKARFPRAPVFAVGYSLGGVFLTKYLAEADMGLHASVAAMTSAFEPFQGSGLVAAAVVSTPVCLFGANNNLSQPWTVNYLYNVAVAHKLREYMEHHRDSIKSNQANTVFDVDRAMKHLTVGQMEEAGIPNTFGFNNRQEYYEAASSLKFIPHIRTPTLFLVAEDDPFLGVLPDEECNANPHTLLAATKAGGHCAFLQGLWPLGPAWSDNAVIQFLEAAWQHLPPPAVDASRGQQGSLTSPVGPLQPPTGSEQEEVGVGVSSTAPANEPSGFGRSLGGQQGPGNAQEVPQQPQVPRNWLEFDRQYVGTGGYQEADSWVAAVPGMGDAGGTQHQWLAAQLGTSLEGSAASAAGAAGAAGEALGEAAAGQSGGGGGGVGEAAMRDMQPRTEAQEVHQQGLPTTSLGGMYSQAQVEQASVAAAAAGGAGRSTAGAAGDSAMAAEGAAAAAGVDESAQVGIENSLAPEPIWTPVMSRL